MIFFGALEFAMNGSPAPKDLTGARRMAATGLRSGRIFMVETGASLVVAVNIQLLAAVTIEDLSLEVRGPEPVKHSKKKEGKK